LADPYKLLFTEAKNPFNSTVFIFGEWTTWLF